MKVTLDALLPRLLNRPALQLTIIDHGSKTAMLANLPNRLRGYANRNSEDIRVLVLVDRDNDDCRALKAKLEHAAIGAGLHTKTAPDHAGCFSVVNRIVVEELEAWFLGDVAALRSAYPGVSATLSRKAAFRDPDAVTGGTWEALHRVLTGAGHYDGTIRLPKIEVARRIAGQMTPQSNRSRSFQVFAAGLAALVA